MDSLSGIIEWTPEILTLTSTCNACGYELEEDAALCVRCGANVHVHNSHEAKVIAPTDSPLATLPDSTPAYVPQNNLEGIGGWLILTRIGLLIGPFLRIRGIVQDSDFLFSAQHHVGLVAKPGLEALLFYELVTNSFFLILFLLLNFLLYSRRRSFPGFMIFYLAATVVTQLIDHLWVTHLGSDVAWTAVLQVAVPAAIWIPYFFSSIRVKLTFVN